MMVETVISDITERLGILAANRSACELQFRLQLAAFDGAQQELEAMLQYYKDTQDNHDEGGSE